MNIILTFTLLMIPGAVTSISVTGYSEGGVIITCKYEKQYRTNMKYFCRSIWSGCSDLIRTNIKDEWVNDGRFSLYDDTRAAVFTVIIRDLNKQDSGTYYCGFYAHLYAYTEVNLKVREGIQRRTVTGYSGGNIIINSKYEKEHTNRLKYICKTKTTHPCFDLIYSKNRSEWSHNDRLSIHDDKTAGLLQVFIRELNVEDSGKYRIIFQVSEDYSFFSELNLDVKEDDCCEKVISLSATSGESVNISCRYPQSHWRDSKFFCRISGADTCAHETSVNVNRRWTQERQLQLYDDREVHLLTVIISNVTDSAEYWCGVQPHQQYKIFITRVQLNVTDIQERTCSSSSSSSSSVLVPQITEVVQTDFSLNSTVTTTDFFVIITSELLVLVLVGLSLLLVLAIRKKKQSHGFKLESRNRFEVSSDPDHTDTITAVVYTAVH
ncbi:polymeric immunoglobulin receptor-like isoform X3 [Myxocyprinus asiaticus]|uniref:polymeric immunoglobulin receptor-like isoform X3 n=1 Tax=Myxocyprinus asiaticus TaxID=70543 RepID=UPI0022231110|nr:polymeric immunoglobulin receptor-like isoform X3 [Myxocyprinus asiaticus]